MNKYKNDPDYGDFKHEERKEQKAEAAEREKALARKNFWKEINMQDSNDGRSTVLWYGTQFIGLYNSMRSAQSKAEDMFENLIINGAS